MKHIYLFLFIFPIIVFGQKTLPDNPWVGVNKEYLQIEKKSATLTKGFHFQEFAVRQYLKDGYIVFTAPHISGIYWQRYKVILFSKDTLILEPEGSDVFRLSQRNENNQYVFTNSLNGFTFEKLHFTTTIIDESLGVNISILLDIDSSRNSRVKLHDDYMNETNIVTTQMTKIEYKQLLQILSAFDLSMLSEDFANKGKDITKYEAKQLRISKDVVLYGERGTKECSNSFFEIRYNDQVTKCKGCPFVPFYYPALKDFLLRYISTKSYQSGRNPKVLY